MTRNTLILFVGIALCVFSPLQISEANPVSKKPDASKSIIEDLLANKEICSTKNIFAKSRFIKHCENVKFPTPDATLDVNDAQQFLCLGIYDRIARLCLLDSKRNVKTESVIPKDSETFDSSVVTLPKNSEEAFTFCQKWEIVYPPLEPKIKNYTLQLDKAFRKPLLCVKMCANDAGEFNPLCSVLEAMENLSSKMTKVIAVPKTEKVEETVHDENKSQLPANAEIKMEAAPKKDATSKEAPPKTQQSEASSHSADKDNKQVVEDKNNGAPSAQGESQQSKVAVPETPTRVSEVAKPAALPPSPPKDEPQEEKEKKVAESERPAPADVGKIEDDKKDNGQAPPPSENVGGAPENQPAPVEENNEGEKGTEYEGQISKNAEEISDDTQDHQEPDGGDEMSEIESPIVLPNGDIEESPAMPSEKQQEFHPRMPSIRNDDDSHFFSYFTVIGVICIAGYVGYHNKQKIFAMVLEGRRSRGSRGRRRPSTANYRKLDCTLEEAVTSQCNSNVTHVIY